MKRFEVEKYLDEDEFELVIKEEYSNGKIKTSWYFGCDFYMEKHTFDENGRIKRITRYNEDGLADGLSIKLDENGYIVEEVEYSDGHPISDNIFIYDFQFQESDWFKLEGALINGITCTKETLMDEIGNYITRVGYYVNENLRHGKWTSYHCREDLDFERLTLEEIENMESLVKPEIEAIYDYGTLKNIRIYSDKQNLKYKANFIDGIIDDYTEYDENQRIISRAYTKHKSFHQEIIEYDEDGKIDFTMSFINGVEVEEETKKIKLDGFPNLV